MENYIDRMKSEKSDLEQRITKLLAFMESDEFAQLDDIGNEVMEMPSDDWTSVARDGSENTYFHNYHYTDTGSSSLRGLLFGGRAGDGANAGLVYSNSNNVPTNTNTNVGSRLCFVA